MWPWRRRWVGIPTQGMTLTGRTHRMAKQGSIELIVYLYDIAELAELDSTHPVAGRCRG